MDADSVETITTNTNKTILFYKQKTIIPTKQKHHTIYTVQISPIFNHSKQELNQFIKH